MKIKDLLGKMGTLVIAAVMAVTTMTATAAPASAYSDYSMEADEERHIGLVKFAYSDVLLFIHNKNLYMACYDTGDNNNGRILFKQDGYVFPKSDVSYYRNAKTPEGLLKRNDYLVNSEEGWEKGPIKIMSSVKSICAKGGGNTPDNAYKAMDFCIIKNDNSLWYVSAEVPYSASVTNIKKLKFRQVKIADNISDALYLGNRLYVINKDKELIYYDTVNDSYRRHTGFKKVEKILDNVAMVDFNEASMHFAAVKTDNTLWEWGAGCFANGKKSTDWRTSPQQTMKNVKYVSLFSGNADNDGGAVIGTDGKTYAWGTKFKYHTFDTGYVYKEYGKTPVCISKSGIAKYVVGNSTDMYLSTKGTLYFSGTNNAAQIAGCGEKYSEKLVKQLTNVTEVAMLNTVCAVICVGSQN